jgi:hypothetical protein
VRSGSAGLPNLLTHVEFRCRNQLIFIATRWHHHLDATGHVCVLCVLLAQAADSTQSRSVQPITNTQLNFIVNKNCCCWLSLGYIFSLPFYSFSNYFSDSFPLGRKNFLSVSHFYPVVCVCVNKTKWKTENFQCVLSVCVCVCLTTSGKNKIPFSFRNHPSLHVFGGCHFRAASQVDELFKGKNFGNSYCNNMLEVKTWENTRKNGVFYLVLCEGYIAHVTSIFNHVNSILFASLITWIH